MVKKKEKNFVIPRKAMEGIAPAIAISAILISRRGPGELLLFFIGIFCGVFIMKGWGSNRT